MSLDNVLGVAAAAKGDIFLLAFSIAVSIPIIIWGSTLVLAMMDRFPITITLGAGLLGWVGGSMGISDVAISGWMVKNFPSAHWIVPTIGAIFVVAIGSLLKKNAASSSTEIVDLAQRKSKR